MAINHKFNHHPWWEFILPVCLFLGGLSLIYLLECFEFDTDEGINLIKAFLVNNDYQLYEEIWNDQPPMLTHLLAWSFNIMGANINVSRSIILLFSTLILWQTWRILYVLGGITHAFIGSLFLLISPNYLRFSISVMVGLPCLTLAMGAITTIIQWHLSKKTIWLIVSALLLSLSITTKLFTFFLAPIIVVGIVIEQIINHPKIDWHKRLQIPALWIAIFLSSTFYIFITLVGLDNIDLLIDNHVTARSIPIFQEISLKDSIKNNYMVFLVGFTSWGTLIAYQRKQWNILYFSAWLITAFLLLWQHKPVWDHHVLLIHIPALVLVGYALGEIITKIIPRQNFPLTWNRKKTLIFLGVAIFVSCLLLIGEQTKTAIRTVRRWHNNCGYKMTPASVKYSFLTEIMTLKSQTKWIVTDLPIFAFRAGIPVPPPVAVISRKQIATSNIDEQNLINVINEYQPEQVFLGRFEWPELTSFLNQHYQLKRQEQNFRLYVRASNSE